MKFSQDVLISVYSTHNPHPYLFEMILTAILVLVLLGVTLIAKIMDNKGVGEDGLLSLTMITVPFLLFSCVVTWIYVPRSPAWNNGAYYLVSTSDSPPSDYDVKYEDVNKAIKAKYDLSASKRSNDTYKDGHGAIYHNCRVSFTKPVNNHIVIKSMSCTKGENLIPVKVK